MLTQKKELLTLAKTDILIEQDWNSFQSKSAAGYRLGLSTKEKEVSNNLKNHLKLWACLN